VLRATWQWVVLDYICLVYLPLSYRKITADKIRQNVLDLKDSLKYNYFVVYEKKVKALLLSLIYLHSIQLF